MKYKNEEQTQESQRRVAYTAQEVAQKLGVSIKSIYRLCQRGHLRRSKAFRTLVIPASSLEEFLKNSSE